MMAIINIKVSEDLMKKMEKHSGIDWEAFLNKAIAEYISIIEEELVITTNEVKEKLGEDIIAEIDKISLEEAIENYEKMRKKEWKNYMTQMF